MAFSTETQILLHDLNNYFRGWKNDIKRRIRSCWDAFCNIPYFIGEAFMALLDFIVEGFFDGLEWLHKKVWKYCGILKKYGKLLFIGKPPFDEVIYDKDRGDILIPPQPEDGRIVMVELGRHNCWVLRSKHQIEDWANLMRMDHGTDTIEMLLEFKADDGEWRTRRIDGRNNELFNPENCGEDTCYLDRIGVRS